MAGAIPVPRLDLVFLGVEVLLSAGDRRRLAQFEAAIDAVVAAERRRQHQPRAEAGAPARLEEQRIDVGRVDEEVRPHRVAAFGGRQLDQVVGQFLLGVAPGEIRIGLGEADLGEALHDLGPGEGLRQEDRVRIAVADFADHPLPERKRLGVRIVDAEDAHIVLAPEQNDVAERVPHRRQAAAVELDVDDVLVFLRRVLGVFDGAVGSPVEPFRVLLDPGMVGRAVDGEVDGDIEPVIARGRNQAGEILERAEFGMKGVMAAILRTDGIRAARIVRRRPQRVVAALAVGAADRVNWREVEHVETEIADIRQPLDDIVKRAVAVHITRGGARKQLVPRAERSFLALDQHGEFAGVERKIRANAGAIHQRGGVGGHQQGQPRRGIVASRGKLRQQRGQRGAVRFRCAVVLLVRRRRDQGRRPRSVQAPMAGRRHASW